MNLQGKVALVTGGGTGIGAAVAERFVAEGAKVCITGRRQDKLDEVAAKLPAGSVVKCPGDIAEYDDIKKMIAATMSISGKIDILINNAAISMPGKVTELSIEDWRKVIDVDLTAPFILMKEIMPHMMEIGGGSIINICSIGALRALPGNPAYASAKAGLIFLTQQAAFEYGPYNIRCNAVCPGATWTAMLERGVQRRGKEYASEGIESLMKRFSTFVPLRRVCQPSEIASVCFFLASDDASYMTGNVIPVDGGSTIVDVEGTSFQKR
jgi:meso-butanediol dehydrogenase/(S,S)-butanediol dehydrogenase/diacetyl reductase